MITTRLLRKKYLYKNAAKEKDFLLKFYRDKDDPRARKIAMKLDNLNDYILERYLDQYVKMKSCDYKVLQNEHYCTNLKLRLDLKKLQE